MKRTIGDGGKAEYNEAATNVYVHIIYKRRNAHTQLLLQAEAYRSLTFIR